MSPDQLYVTTETCSVLVIVAYLVGMVVGWMLRHDKPRTPAPDQIVLRYVPPRHSKFPFNAA